MGCVSSNTKETSKETGHDKNNEPSNLVKESEQEIEEIKLDSIGPNYNPPPGGRSSAYLSGGPPVDLKGNDGVQTEDGKIYREKVALKSGSIYIGQWNKKNIRSGQGKITYPDGSEYEGQFENDYSEGVGSWKDKLGNSCQGQWVKGQLHGQAEFNHSDGSKYNGEWKKDLKEGYGKECWPDGTTFDGEFNQGAAQKGTMSFKNGDVYTGGFFEDEFSGFGTYAWKNGSCYEGQWKNGLMHGKGNFKYTTKGALEYDGNFKEGLKSGEGVLYFKDKRIYKGKFSNNLQNGEGMEIWPSGAIHKGIWQNGVVERWLDQKRISLGPEVKGDTKEFETSIYSDPKLYQDLLKQSKKGIAKLEVGVLKKK